MTDLRELSPAHAEAMRTIEKQAKLIEDLIGELKAAEGYMVNAQVTLGTATKQSADKVLTDGIKRIREALEKAK